MDITFTCTTSKRFKLFKQTMDSFMECCLDKDMIVKWLVSDDRSSDEEIQLMKDLYPFLEVLRCEGHGQAANLNSLFKRVETDYIFHCEDDWLFKQPAHFIKESLEIMEDDHRIKNIILRQWNGVRVTSHKTKFIMHYHHPNLEPHIASRYDARWIGYSLNPGVQNLSVIKQYLPYREDFKPRQQHWDRLLAFRYLKDGYKRASLIGDYIQHLG